MTNIQYNPNLQFKLIGDTHLFYNKVILLIYKILGLISMNNRCPLILKLQNLVATNMVKKDND